MLIFGDFLGTGVRLCHRMVRLLGVARPALCLSIFPWVERGFSVTPYEKTREQSKIIRGIT